MAADGRYACRFCIFSGWLFYRLYNQCARPVSKVCSCQPSRSSKTCTLSLTALFLLEFLFVIETQTPNPFFPFFIFFLFSTADVLIENRRNAPFMSQMAGKFSSVFYLYFCILLKSDSVGLTTDGI